MQTATKDSTSTAAAAASAKKRGWWRRNWKRLLGSLVLIAVLGAVGGYLYKFAPILTSEPYRQAIAELEKSPQVKQLLGESVKAGWFPAGSVNRDEGEARIYLQVHGPKTADGHAPKADVSVQARLVGGKWGFTQFDLTSDKGQRLNLMDEINGEQPPDVLPFDAKNVPPPQAKMEVAPPKDDVNIQIPDLPSDTGGK